MSLDTHAIANIIGGIATPFAMAGAWLAANRTSQPKLWFPVFLAGSILMLASMLVGGMWGLVPLEAYFVWTNSIGTWKAFHPIKPAPVSEPLTPGGPMPLEPEVIGVVQGG